MDFILGIIVGMILLLVIGYIQVRRSREKDELDGYEVGYKDGKEDGYYEGLYDAKFKSGKE